MSTLAIQRLGSVLLLVAAGLLLAAPLGLDVAHLLTLNVMVIMGILALSMALVWGGSGVFSFGQSVFFGVGAYVYAIGTLSTYDSTWPLLLAIVGAAAAAAIVGYFLFYGRVGEVYFAVITLALSLLCYQLINAQASLRIGGVALGGYNGIPGVPPLNLPGNPDHPLGFSETYWVCAGLLIVLYLAVRALLRSRFGQTVAAIRENELRAELLGYDSRRYKLIVFVVGAAIAGLAGALFAAWGNFIGPDVFSMMFAAQIIIWAQVGGVGVLVGPILGAFLIQWLITWLGTTGVGDTNVVLGLIFIGFVLFVPAGLLPALRKLLERRHDGL